MRSRRDCCRECTIEVWKFFAAARYFPAECVAKFVRVKLNQQQVVLPAKVFGQRSGQL